MKLTVNRLGHLGDGIAEGPEGPVYLQMVLPGEEVEAEVIGDQGRGVKILTPSTDRVAAPCRHYKSCGGCSLQHASNDFVARFKTNVVRRALEARGLSAPVEAMHISPPQSRRRATLSGRRTKSGAMVGFHGRASDVLTEIPDCKLLRPEILALVPVLKEITALGGSRSAEVSLTLSLTETGPDLAVSGAKPADPAMLAAISRVVAGKIARVTWNGEPLVLDRSPKVRLGPALVPMPAGAFMQATDEGEAALVAAVRRAIGPAPRVIDLFAGMGTFALPLAETAEVHAVEGSKEMMLALDAGWRATPGLKRVTTETRDLFRRPVYADELDGFDAAVIDPPRAGAEAQCAELAKSKISRIAMVSCNPVTFARDAEMLVKAGFSMDSLQVVDQFRWSAHVELVARFTKG